MHIYFVTAFSGAYIASAGGVGLLTGAEAAEIVYEIAWYGNTEVGEILLGATFVLGCTGFAVQKRRFSRTEASSNA